MLDNPLCLNGKSYLYVLKNLIHDCGRRKQISNLDGLIIFFLWAPFPAINPLDDPSPRDLIISFRPPYWIINTFREKSEIKIQK